MLNRHLVFLTLMLGLFIWISACRLSEPEEENPASVREIVKQVPTVKIKNVWRGDMSVPIYSTGTLFPDQESKIGPKISGTVGVVYVEEGDHVTKGQALAQLDHEELLITERQCLAAIQMAEIGLKESELRVENLKKEKQRLADLLEKNAASRQKYDEIDTAFSMAVTGLDVANAQILNAKENLAMTRQKLKDVMICAPFSGLIVQRFINRGEYVTTMPPTPLFLIMNIERIKVELGLPEIHLSQVSVGNPVDIIVDTYAGTTFRGKISSINPMVDPISRAFTIKIDIPNKDRKLKPGMFARVRIYPEIHKDTLIVPFKSVVEQNDHAYVYVLNGDTVNTRKIITGITDDKDIEVVEGLNEGEAVVVEGHYGMADKTKVEVIGE